jgi:hypothetical protein
MIFFKFDFKGTVLECFLKGKARKSNFVMQIWLMPTTIVIHTHTKQITQNILNSASLAKKNVIHLH